MTNVNVLMFLGSIPRQDDENVQLVHYILFRANPITFDIHLVRKTQLTPLKILYNTKSKSLTVS